MACLMLGTCAPSIQTDSPGRILISEDETARNLEALEELSHRHEQSQRPDQQLDENAQPALPVLPVTVLEPAPTAAELGEGRIDRSDLTAFIEGGPYGLISAVDVEPIIEGEAFRGYRIAALDPTAAAIYSSGLRVGDIVTTVNGYDISRPESFMAAWESMAEAEHLHVDIVRAGDAQTLAWAIE
jgi:hypothetical protein